MKIFTILIGVCSLVGIVLCSPTQTHALSIGSITQQSTSVKVYEKHETRFAVDTVATHPFFQYDSAPPTGVSPRTGVTVEGIYTTPSGKTIRHPAFFTSEVTKSGSVYVETNKKYWVLRFSPLETGTYTFQITAQDASGTNTVSAGSFQATAPTRNGFIQVSAQDPRYFEYSNGSLYFPIGPANISNGGYASYKDSGANLERPWIGGMGIYSTNWARWKSSAELHGNEGIKTRFSWREKFPGHDLSYELFYNSDPAKGPNGFRTWISAWMDDNHAGKILAGKRYQVKLVFKAANISGPRNASNSQYGFVIRAADPQWNSDAWSPDQWDTTLRPFPALAPSGTPHFTSSSDPRCQSVQSGWCTYTTTFTAPKNQDSFYLYLENVTAGEVYVDEFSMKEIDGSGAIIGGEIIRNSLADQHTYVEARPAAAFDDRLTNAENNGVFLKLVVHDKNDWIQDHLRSDGTWADSGNGYYQLENTKARWLLRQWYRYVVARWGYSTALHSVELNNEGPPNEDPPGTGSAPHWRTAQAFAKYVHDIYPARRILATTSFWCCWRPSFFGNSTAFPDIDYADLHVYTSNIENGLIPSAATYDFALWTLSASTNSYKEGYPRGKNGVGKPAMLGETGVDNGEGYQLLQETNPGIWYHNMIWAQLNEGAMSNPLYWHDQHLLKMTATVPQQTRPFYLFVKDLDLHRGGYGDAQATSANTKLRIIGQKNLAKNSAHLWIQNTDHTWKKYRDGVRSSQSGTVSVTLAANTTYSVEWWDTYAGNVQSTQQLLSDSTGKLALSVSNLSTDTAVKITRAGGNPSTTPTPTPPATSSAEACNADIDQVGSAVGTGFYAGTVNLSDFAILTRDFLRSPPTNPRSNINQDAQNQVNLSDYTILVRWFLRPVTCAR